MAIEAPIPHPRDWPVVTLREIATKIGSGATPRGGSEAYLDSRINYALIRSQNVFDRHFDRTGLAFITDDQARALQQAAVRMGDLLLNITGDGITFSRCCAAPEDVLPACVNQHVSIVRVNPELADPGYVLGFLTHPTVKNYIESFNAGGSRRAITKGHIESFRIPLPPPEEQKAIAKILGALDDKIELNRRMNGTLEAMARTLFKSWFVDFDPVHAKAEGRDPGLPAHLASLFPDSFEGSELGEIPAGWRVGSVGELATLHKTTVSPGSKPSDTFAHYSIPAYDEGRIPRIEEGLDIKSNKFTIPRGAVLVSKLNPSIPRVWLVDVGGRDRPICSTEFLVVLPRSAHYREFLYLLFKSDHSRRELTGMATGTSNSHQRVRPEGLMEMRIAIPPRQLLSRFSESCAPMMERANHSIWESASIASLRDSLLPKLISGQLRLDQPPHPDWSAAGTCNAR